MRISSVLVAAAAFVLTSAACADEISVSFSRAEVEIIARYYHYAPLPPESRHGGKPLPRGIAKQLARGKPLPPGLAKQPLPRDLAVLLPPPPAGHERIVVAGKVLLVEMTTQVVRDVLTDVLFH